MNIKEMFDVLVRGEKPFYFPLKYDNHGTYIFDAKDNMVLQMRGWGRLQYEEQGKGAEIQDTFANWVVDTLNVEAKTLGLW